MAKELARRGRELLGTRTLLPSFFREEMDRMNRLFDEFFGREEMAPMVSLWGPPIDIMETENNVIIKADLPGIDPQSLDISISDDTLTLKGEKKEEKEEKGENYYLGERRYGQFSRSIALPCSVDSNKIDAQYHNGVLKIEMPKMPEAQRKKIQVKVT